MKILHTMTARMFISMVITGSSGALSIVTQIILVRLIGLATIGEFLYWRNNIRLAATLGRNGLHALTLAKVSAMQAAGQTRDIARFAQFSFMVAVPSTALAIAGVTVLTSGGQVPVPPFWPVALAILSTAALFVLVPFYRSTGNLHLSLVLDRLGTRVMCEKAIIVG